MTDHGRTYRFEARDEKLWRSVVDAVGFVTGADSMEMDPLFDSVDPEVFESLAGSEAVVSFSMEGAEVSVSGEGEIVVEGGGCRSCLTDRLDRGASVLMLAPDGREVDDDACIDLSFGETSELIDVLGVSFGQSADDRVSAWAGASAGAPGDVAVVDVAQQTRSGAAVSAPDRSPEATHSFDVDRLQDATDLAALGSRITERIETWTDRENGTAVCFHSVTAMLMHVDDATAFRFLHILTEQLDDAGVAAHFHMDPLAHDERTVRTFEPLFDAVVDVDGNGDWTVTTDTRVDSV